MERLLIYHHSNAMLTIAENLLLLLLKKKHNKSNAWFHPMTIHHKKQLKNSQFKFTLSIFATQSLCA